MITTSKQNFKSKINIVESTIEKSNININTKSINTKSINNKSIDNKPINTKPIDTKLIDTKPINNMNLDLADDFDGLDIEKNNNKKVSSKIDINELFAKKKKKKIAEMKKYIPFIEKYRPKDINDLILPPTMQFKIANIIESKTLPNIIITGSPGTGKTSTILCLARKILGKDYRDLTLELNASNNRTLDFINTTVAYFCRKKLSSDTNTPKLIIFDEADNITKKAQNLLANLMEEHSHNTRFAFTCNESNKIIESIQSRCMILRYIPMTSDAIKNKLENICHIENIEYDESGIDAVNFISQGDVRLAINNLEATYHGYKKITESNVFKLCFHPHPKLAIEIIKECVGMNIIKSLDYIHDLKNSGYCINDILLTLLYVLREIKIDEDIRINFTKIISDSYIIVSDGIDTNLQLYACLARMIKYIRDTPQ